jgi:hypothetical protein
MKQFLKFYLLVILIVSAKSYSQDIYSERPAATIDLIPVYENWSINDSSDFSEFTNVITAGYNPYKNTTLGLATRYASVGTSIGNVNNNLSGLSDLQLMIKQRFPDQNIIFDGGLNIPSGKTKLSPEEFVITQVISQELFGLRTSNFGQGLNAFLGVTWLHPMSDNVVIGAGVSYQLKSEYQPLADVGDKYTPSNEISLTAGLDIKLSETQTVSGDFTGIFYGSDQLNGNDIFGFDNLTIYILYRDVAIAELKGAYAVLDKEKITPNQLYIGGNYNQRFTASFSMGYGLFTNIYEETAAYLSGYTLYGISLSPQFSVSPSVSIPVFLKYAIGNADGKSDLHNYVISGGIKVDL